MTKDTPNFPAFNNKTPELATSPVSAAETAPVETGIVILHGKPMLLDEAKEFLTDAAREKEGLLKPAMVQEKYGIDNLGWKQLANDDLVQKAIRPELERRIRNGVAKREAAQMFVVGAPAILDSIMRSNAPASTRNEAAKTLDHLATEPASVGISSGEQFRIIINLGAGVPPVDIKVTDPQPTKDPIPIETDSTENNTG